MSELDHYLHALNTLIRPIRAGSLPRTLEPMRRLLTALGNPHLKFDTILIAGSTGKGTAAAGIALEKMKTGARIGLYTSPHLHLFRERIAIDGTIIPRAAFIEGASRVRAAADALERIDSADSYSTFELTTALALDYFAREGVATAVLEIGIGGRFDAVNAVQGDEAHPGRVIEAFITPIELEHAAMLGTPEAAPAHLSTPLARIAWHKAGILPPNGRAISMMQPDEVRAVLEAEARARHTTLIFTDTLQWGWQPLPGRLERHQWHDHEIWIDGAHTPLAARHLRARLEASGDLESVFIVGMLRDKRIADTLAALDDGKARFLLTTAPGDRAASAQTLMEALSPSAQTRARVEMDIDIAFASIAVMPANTRVVICGSLRMAAAAREYFGLITGDDLEEAQGTRALFEGDSYARRLPPLLKYPGVG